MLEVGDEIREYTLKVLLGRGSFGEVWLAEKRIELADEGILFALKFLSDEHGRGGQAENVRSEVKTWIRAGNHFNIVPVYDGFIYGRFLVIVSEYVDGGSLRDYLVSNGGKRLSLEEAVELMRGILRGLSHLHVRQIVHRDLKPENVLLKEGVPRITDFGVSRVVETLSLDATPRYTRGAGSPLYMSPESFGDVIPVPQQDVWSAGVIFFELLTGGILFNANNLAALCMEITNNEAKPLPAYVPKELQDVVFTSLTKDPSLRFPSSTQMREA